MWSTVIKLPQIQLYDFSSLDVFWDGICIAEYFSMVGSHTLNSYFKVTCPRDRIIQILLGLTFIFNLLDAVLTLFAVNSGLAVEANPIMNELLARGSMHFMLTKLLMVSLGIILLWRLRRQTLAYIASIGVCGVYTLILFVHMQGLSPL